MSIGDSERREAAQEWLRRWGASARSDAELPRLAADIDAQLRAAVPEVTADEGMSADLASSSYDGLRAFLPSLAVQPVTPDMVPPATRDLARSFAYRRLDLTVLLKLYRVGFDALWRRVMTAVADTVTDAEMRMAILELAWETSSQSLEVILDVLVEIYTEERERRLTGALARRQETVHAILRGDAIEPDTAERWLAHPMRRHQTALVIWGAKDVGVSESLATLERIAAALAQAIDAPPPMSVPSGAHALWAWIATDREPDHAAFRSAPAVSALAGARVAVGMTGYGLDGLRSSHREALLAQRVALAGSRPSPLTLYKDVEVVSLLSADPVAMRALIARELAALADEDPATARLRETARAFLAAGGNARIAAETLGTHKNTVLYRLGGIEALLGHPIADRRLSLELALLLHDAFGSAPRLAS